MLSGEPHVGEKKDVQALGEGRSTASGDASLVSV